MPLFDGIIDYTYRAKVVVDAENEEQARQYLSNIASEIDAGMHMQPGVDNIDVYIEGESKEGTPDFRTPEVEEHDGEHPEFEGHPELPYNSKAEEKRDYYATLKADMEEE